MPFHIIKVIVANSNFLYCSFFTEFKNRDLIPFAALNAEYEWRMENWLI